MDSMEIDIIPTFATNKSNVVVDNMATLFRVAFQ
jgi:hypothetical protein